MGDRDSRDRLALALRQLASGLITNDQFDGEAFGMFSHRTDDPALAELSTYGWLHYSDLSTYRLKGRHALSREERTSIARAVLFLKTDQDYVHGDCVESATCLGKPFLRGCLITAAIAAGVGVFTHLALTAFWLGFVLVIALAYLGNLLRMTVLARLRRRDWKQGHAGSNDTFWPFMDARAANEQFRFWPFGNKQAYELALANRPFLCGRVSTSR